MEKKTTKRKKESAGKDANPHKDKNETTADMKPGGVLEFGITVKPHPLQGIANIAMLFVFGVILFIGICAIWPVDKATSPDYYQVGVDTVGWEHQTQQGYRDAQSYRPYSDTLWLDVDIDMHSQENFSKYFWYSKINGATRTKWTPKTKPIYKKRQQATFTEGELAALRGLLNKHQSLDTAMVIYYDADGKLKFQTNGGIQ